MGAALAGHHVPINMRLSFSYRRLWYLKSERISRPSEHPPVCSPVHQFVPHPSLLDRSIRTTYRRRSSRLFSWQPRNLLTLGREFESRHIHTNWDFSSHHAQQWRTIISWVHRVRLPGRRGKGTAEYFSREKLSQREILCDLPPAV